MQTPARRFASAFTSLALILGTAACGGGGGDDATDQASAAAPDADRATALARRKPPPPPAATTDATLALASATASGQAVAGNICGVSADGAKVLFTSPSDMLVSGDNRPFLDDIFLKNFNGNDVVRVVNTVSRSLACLAMTPDANTVVFTADATNGQVDVLGNSGTEPAILVQNLATGQQTRVTPLLSTLGNVSAFQFAGVSDDGLRVAFIAQPTRTCSGYDCTATGPARMLVRDLATGSLINLESQVRFTTSQGFADGTALLAPNGRSLAFSTRAAYPEAASPGGGVFVFDFASASVRLVNADAAGRQVQLGDVRAFLSNSSKLAFYNASTTNAGPAGVYVKDLAVGSLVLMPANLTLLPGSSAPLSFSDDGRRVSYVQSNGLGGQFFNSVPRVLDLSTGAIVNAATLSNGTVGNGNVTVSALLSRDGRVAAFDNNSTNLLGGLSPLGGAELRAYRKLLP